MEVEAEERGRAEDDAKATKQEGPCAAVHDASESLTNREGSTQKKPALRVGLDTGGSSAEGATCSVVAASSLAVLCRLLGRFGGGTVTSLDSMSFMTVSPSVSSLFVKDKRHALFPFIFSFCGPSAQNPFHVDVFSSLYAFNGLL